MKTRQSTYPLRLPRSVKAEVESRAKADGISVNQFVATAVAEKLAAMNTAAFFAERRERADFAAFDRLMRRKGGEQPQPEDRMPRSAAKLSSPVPAKAGMGKVVPPRPAGRRREDKLRTGGGRRRK
jgi:post-segregation antitoxin (ccd killing protein)